MSRLLALSIFFLLTGCSTNLLTVYTEYINPEDLASYHVRTPDPRLTCPQVGQHLIVSWSLPKNYLNYEDLHILITIRFRNREEEEKRISICKATGTYYYTILNEQFFEKGGILTYKCELIGSGEILAKWCHQIWVDLITIDTSEELSDDQYDITDDLPEKK